MPGVNLPLTNEDELNLVLSVVSPTDGLKRIIDGQEMLLLNGAQISPDMATISKSAMESLYNEVAGFTTSEKRCLTVLSVSYGAEEAGGDVLMKLFYQPLFLSFTNYEANTDSYMYEITEFGNWYCLDNGTFAQTTTGEMENALALYKTNFTSKHMPDEGFSAFEEGVDVEKIYIPFQTIFSVYHDNDNTNLIIKNSVDIIKNLDSNSVKQCLILYAIENKNQGQFGGKYADRHLFGPPYSSKLGYDLL